ncbi:MAG: hypothetical protein M1337_04460 [Actinobacteria bacterium]|nr:hypothetical protein [Actinomycetota bacterium]
MLANSSCQPMVVARRVLIRGEAYRLPLDASGVRVRSGRAWLSVGGEDIILNRGGEVPLGLDGSKSDFGVVSPVGGVPLLIEVLGCRERLPRQGLRPVFGNRT